MNSFLRPHVVVDAFGNPCPGGIERMDAGEQLAEAVRNLLSQMERRITGWHPKPGFESAMDQLEGSMGAYDLANKVEP